MKTGLQKKPQSIRNSRAMRQLPKNDTVSVTIRKEIFVLQEEKLKSGKSFETQFSDMGHGTWSCSSGIFPARFHFILAFVQCFPDIPLFLPYGIKVCILRKPLHVGSM